MAYWLIQAFIAIILIFGGLSDIDTDMEMYGLGNTLAHTGLRVVVFFLTTHFLIRAPIHFLRNQESGIIKISLFGLVFVVISAYMSTTLRDLNRDIFTPIDKKIAYYDANPSKDPLNQQAQETTGKGTAKQQQNSAKTVQSEFKKGVKEGIKEGLLEARLEDQKIAQGDQNAIDRAFKKRFQNAFFTYLIWLICYLPISALRRRFQVKNQLKQSQIALLMSQLNPHFLFNSLNSIRGMIFEDKQLAKELIDKLNELFKYNLTANKNASVKLKEELRICEFYLDIEHIRLEERLLIEMHVDETCLNYKLPTMGLLTLIENAVKHGIAPRQEQSLLVVDISKQKGSLVITVTNPVYIGNHKVQSTGTGQDNLIKRLQLMYLENASLRADACDDKYIATLTLPL